MTGLRWSHSRFTPARAESGSARSGCVPPPLEPKMAKFGMFACSVWNDFFILVLSESLARNCISCGPYAGSCKDLTQRCKSVSWWGAGGVSGTLFFPPFLLLWGWQKNPNKTTTFCHFRDVYFGRNQFILWDFDQRYVENAPELGCSPGQSPTEKSPEVSGAALSGSEMIRESDRSHSSRRDHPHPMGAAEAWKSFCLRVCVSEPVNLRELGSILGHEKLRPSHPPVAGPRRVGDGSGGCREAPGAARLPRGARGFGGGDHLGGFSQLLALGLLLVPSTHGSPSRSRSHPGRNSAPVFRAPHILFMTYWTVWGFAPRSGADFTSGNLDPHWKILIHPEQREGEKKNQQPSCNACRQALLRYK